MVLGCLGVLSVSQRPQGGGLIGAIALRSIVPLCAP